MAIYDCSVDAELMTGMRLARQAIELIQRQIATRPPLATRLLIQAVDDGLEEPIDKALVIETRAFLETLRTEDAAEGLFAKRTPEFKGR